MGCCGNKEGCKRTQKTAEFLKYSPQEVFDTLQKVGPEFLSKLQELATAGINAGRIFRNFNFQSAVLTQLAKQITDLAVENAYLKDVLNLFSPMDIGLDDSELEIKFGPKHSYSLKLPVTDRNSRREIAKQLRTAADKLEAEFKLTAPVNFDQKMLPFAQ